MTDASRGELITVTESSLPASTVGGLLGHIRPAWRAKSLIERVERLLPVDPSSACQRLLNAALHDLRDKVVIAGLDIAKQAAELHKLPPVAKSEDIENYSNDRIIDLSYRMGLLTRAQWRRLKRCYEIRRDLEHEDDEYEAEVEDCVYIFKTCIEVVLSQDPVELLKVTDVKEVVEQAKPQFPEEQFLEEFQNAPESRQKEIILFLVSTALDESKPEVVRSNSFEMMKHLNGGTRDSVRIEVAQHLQKRIGRNVAGLAPMKVAHAIGAMPYLKKNTRNDFFAAYRDRLKGVGHGWKNHGSHSAILAELEDIGGLEHCQSESTVKSIIKWLVLCYVGEPGGYGYYGRGRSVFYSDTAVPIIKRIVKKCGSRELDILKQAKDEKSIKVVLGQSKSVAQRYETLLDLAGDV